MSSTGREATSVAVSTANSVNGEGGFHEGTGVNVRLGRVTGLCSCLALQALQLPLQLHVQVHASMCSDTQLRMQTMQQQTRNMSSG